MTQKTDISDEEKAIFRQAMQGVKPISPMKINPLDIRTQAQPKVKLKSNPDNDDKSEYFAFSDYETLAPVLSDDLLAYARPGLQHKILRNLRTGQYTMEARLDLHAMTSKEASIALSRFLASSKSRRLRYVLIIHGKGHSHRQPILKNKLNHWLRQTDDVLAFCSATANEGSAGALYVLLRR